MACPFKFTYSVFCPDCGSHIREEDKKSNEGTCDSCDKDLGPYLKKNEGRFLIFPLRKQVESYLNDPEFTSILRVFSFSKHGRLTGATHTEILEGLHMSMNLGIDAAPLSRESSICIYPAFLHFNNLPLSVQHRYPILLSLYVGPPSKKPPCTRMLGNMQKELRSLETDFVTWRDDRGSNHKSHVFLTLCHSDAVQKHELQCTVGSTSKFCCNYCEYEGESVNINTHPSVYDPGNKFRRTKSDTTSGIRCEICFHIHTFFFMFKICIRIILKSGDPTIQRMGRSVINEMGKRLIK